MPRFDSAFLTGQGVSQPESFQNQQSVGLDILCRKIQPNIGRRIDQLKSRILWKQEMEFWRSCPKTESRASKITPAGSAS